MIYLKINDNIRSLLELIQDSFRLGCKDYCKYQLIALDEFELLRKELEFKNLKTLSDQEYKNLIKSTENVYFHNTHVCISNTPSIIKEEEEDKDITEEELMKELQNDKINKNDIKDYFSVNRPNNFEEEYRIKKEDEDKNFNMTKSEIQKLRTESSLSYAFSMIASFFLLVLGSYYLGKYFFQMSDSNTYKLVLVITIIVLISEMFLLVIKMNKDGDKNIIGKVQENSFAYKFNKNYREIVERAMNKKKVYQKVKKE